MVLDADFISYTSMAKPEAVAFTVAYYLTRNRFFMAFHQTVDD